MSSSVYRVCAQRKTLCLVTEYCSDPSVETEWFTVLQVFLVYLTTVVPDALILTAPFRDEEVELFLFRDCGLHRDMGMIQHSGVTSVLHTWAPSCMQELRTSIKKDCSRQSWYPLWEIHFQQFALYCVGSSVAFGDFVYKYLPEIIVRKRLSQKIFYSSFMQVIQKS